MLAARVFCLIRNYRLFLINYKIFEEAPSKENLSHCKR